MRSGNPEANSGRLRSRWDDRGAVTVEMMYAFPLIFTLILLLAQATIWWHAVHVAQATAADALAVTRVQGGTVGDGQDEAQRVLDQLGRGPLRGVSVRVTRDADGAQVRITGTVSSIVPFLHLPVRVDAAGPVEQFRPAVETSP